MFTPFIKRTFSPIPTSHLLSLSRRFFSVEPKPILGYPLNIQKSPQNKLINPTIIPEYLSYDDFIMQIQMDYTKLDDYHNTKFKTPSGSLYNYWLPAFVNNDHYLRSQQYLFNSISIMLCGVEGKEENDFKPNMVLQTLPPILVKTTSNLLNGTMKNDLGGIEAYLQVYILLKRLVQQFPEIQRSIEQEVEDFYAKGETEDFNEFFIKYGFSAKGAVSDDVPLKKYLKKRLTEALQKGSVESFKKEAQLFLANLESVSWVMREKSEEKLLSEDMKKELQRDIEWMKNNVDKIWDTFYKELEQ